MERGRADPLFDAFYWKSIAIALTLNALTTFTLIAILFGTGFVKNSFGDIVKKFQKEITIITHTIRDNETVTKTEKIPASYLLMPAKDFLGVSVKEPVRSKIFNNLINNLVVEEIVYRAPVRLLTGFMVLWGVRQKRWSQLFVWAIGLSLNLHWAFSIHRGIESLLWIPVFFAGIPWLWLVIRTNHLWPAIFCHTIANLGVFFLVKIYISLT